jgi:hypothetical protein
MDLFVLDGPGGGDQGLGGDLATEHPRGALCRALPPEQVTLYLLQVQDAEQPVQWTVPVGNGDRLHVGHGDILAARGIKGQFAFRSPLVAHDLDTHVRLRPEPSAAGGRREP